MSNEFIHLLDCPICGKRFVPAAQHIYKVCKACRKQHNGCPTMGNGCLYGDDYLDDVVKYLETEVTEE